ncbi:hypothetical protein B0H19DRAFT_1073517 [Mycena capillaripes]|nr:hypothetical protein B0H19DRAFT_1073517 [Mycena capillaripes]
MSKGRIGPIRSTANLRVFENRLKSKSGPRAVEDITSDSSMTTRSSNKPGVAHSNGTQNSSILFRCSEVCGVAWHIHIGEIQRSKTMSLKGSTLGINQTPPDEETGGTELSMREDIAFCTVIPKEPGTTRSRGAGELTKSVEEEADGHSE